MGATPLFRTPEEMQVAIDAYFADCKERGAPLTMSGLALSIGFESRRSLVDYKNKDAFSPTVKRARYIIEQFVEEKMLSSTGVVAGIIFNAKNNFGWQDKQEVDARVQTLTPIMGGAAKADVHSDDDHTPTSETA